MAPAPRELSVKPTEGVAAASEEADFIPLVAIAPSSISVGSFFLIQIKPALLGFDLGRGGILGSLLEGAVGGAD